MEGRYFRGRHHYSLLEGTKQEGGNLRSGFEGVPSCMQEVRYCRNQGGRSEGGGGESRGWTEAEMLRRLFVVLRALAGRTEGPQKRQTSFIMIKFRGSKRDHGGRGGGR